jgi:hypothetical protein
MKRRAESLRTQAADKKNSKQAAQRLLIKYLNSICLLKQKGESVNQLLVVIVANGFCVRCRARGSSRCVLCVKRLLEQPNRRRRRREATAKKKENLHANKPINEK